MKALPSSLTGCIWQSSDQVNSGSVVVSGETKHVKVFGIELSVDDDD